VKHLLKSLMVLFVVGGLCAPSAQAQDTLADLMGGGFEWDFNVGVGQLFFREDFTASFPTYEDRSHDDFDSFVTRVDFCAGNYDFDGLEYGIQLGLTGTESQTLVVTGADVDALGETYYRLAVPADVHCVDLLAEVGCGGTITEGLNWAGLFGYGYRRVELETTVPYDRDYDAHWLNFKGRLLWQATDDLLVLVEPSLGPVFASKRTDDTWGTIRGDGGLEFKLVGVVACKVTDNIILDVGPFYCFQYLNGGDTNVEVQGQTVRLEWNDHLVQAVGATMGVMFLF